MVLLETCPIALTLNFDPDLLSVLEPEAVPQSEGANVFSSVEVRVPCLERDAGRQTLLEGRLPNRYCEVACVNTKFDKYGGPEGYMSVRQV